MDIERDFITEANNQYVEHMKEDAERPGTANPSPGVTDAQAEALRAWDQAMGEWELGGPEGDFEDDDGTIISNPNDDEFLLDASKVLIAAFAK